MRPALDAIHQSDCVGGMRQIPSSTVHLAFADPPFNIGYDYDIYDDARPEESYLDWSRKWMTEVSRVLKPNGTFWLAIGDDYAAELKLIAQRELGFTCRSWVIWYYTFGVNCTRKFSRSHTHLFHFVKDAEDFTFNSQDAAVRVPSARQLVYADNRANPMGRLPDDTWILRPQDLPKSFRAIDDTWYFARIAGTFKERAGFHGCQMPEQLLGRIIRVSSNEGDTVIDPFVGSGTTMVVAKKLGRHWLGFELSSVYTEKAKARLRKTTAGASLNGPSDPLASAPPTPNNGNRHSKQCNGTVDEINTQPSILCADASRTIANGRATRNDRTALELADEKAIVAAYLRTRDGHSSDCVLANPALNSAFVDACRKIGIAGAPAEWNKLLTRLRKAGKIPRLEQREGRVFTDKHLDLFSFGSEIAWELVSSAHNGISLDDILCDPKIAEEFDNMAMSLAPGFTPFEYRWAALSIRKRASHARLVAISFARKKVVRELPRSRRIMDVDPTALNNTPGVYVLKSGAKRLYVGETRDLRRRLTVQLEICTSPAWAQFNLSSVSLIPALKDHRGLQVALIQRFRPLLNCDSLDPRSSAITAA